MEQYVLEIEHLRKLYRNGRGLQEVSVLVEQGDIYGLLGPNGSGKTTTMKILTGLAYPDQGTVRIQGKEMTDRTELSIGSLIEAPALFEYLSAKENLELAARYYHINEKKQQLNKVLELTGLLGYEKEKVKKFSLGMKQRLGIALALLGSPELVILDEPSNGLDIEGIASIRQMIKRCAHEEGVTFLIASHMAHELELMCNKVTVIQNGYSLGMDSIEKIIGNNMTLEEYYLAQIGKGDAV